MGGWGSLSTGPLCLTRGWPSEAAKRKRPLSPLRRAVWGLGLRRPRHSGRLKRPRREGGSLTRVVAAAAASEALPGLRPRGKGQLEHEGPGLLLSPSPFLLWRGRCRFFGPGRRDEKKPEEEEKNVTSEGRPLGSPQLEPSDVTSGSNSGADTGSTPGRKAVRGRKERLRA